MTPTTMYQKSRANSMFPGWKPFIPWSMPPMSMSISILVTARRRSARMIAKLYLPRFLGDAVEFIATKKTQTILLFGGDARRRASVHGGNRCDRSCDRVSLVSPFARQHKMVFELGLPSCDKMETNGGERSE